MRIKVQLSLHSKDKALRGVVSIPILTLDQLYRLDQFSNSIYLINATLLH